jgi:post-segregation antitoxin (ccd killing protein)
MQVYLPDELYREVKQRGLAASELLQGAIAAEVRRLELDARADEYLADLIAEVGEPTEADLARAAALLDRAQGSRPTAKAG